MSGIVLSNIIKYPLKSGGGIDLESGNIKNRGLNLDRHWGLFDPNGKAITARDFPKMLGILPTLQNGSLFLKLGEGQELKIPKTNSSMVRGDLNIFNNVTSGLHVGESVDEKISSYLGTDCRLFFMDDQTHRPTLKNFGGRPGDVVSYADVAPILLLSTASVNDLNGRMEEKVSFRNFRPNLVVSGCEAYAEDTWKSIRIGDCEFDLIQECKRCVFSTINPDTFEKSPNQEPLRTLATYKPNPRGGVSFGMHLIPRKTGSLSLGDEVKILS